MRALTPARPGPARFQRHTPPRNRLAWLQLAIVLLAGGLHAASMAWPFPVGAALLGLVPGQPAGWLQLLALALLAGQLDGARTWPRGAWLGGLFATALHGATFWWLFISMHVYGGLAAPLAVLAVGLLAALLGLLYAAACGVFVALAPAGLAARALFFAATWLLAELARVQVFTGFPWGEGGYAHVDGWARPLASWVGVHGLSFLAALLAAWLAFALLAPKTRWASALAAAALSAALALLPSQGGDGPEADPALARPLAVTLLQGNIPQGEKFELGTGVATALHWYGEELDRARGALVVAPETALPLLPDQLPEGYWPALRARFAAGGQAALIGLPLGDYASGYSNSVLGLKPAAAAGPDAPLAPPVPYRYDKHHLVPFGEVIPPGFRWFIDLMNIPLGDFRRGAVGQPSFEWQGQRLAPNICYEDLFGEELGARFVDAARAPTVFVNVSNIAWFGNTVAIDQHLQISRMRALEFARPMIRATNTGATVIIDHRGAVTHALARHTRGVLTGDVQGRSRITPYAWWVGRLGLWPLWALGLGAGVLAWLARRRRPAGAAPRH